MIEQESKAARQYSTVKCSKCGDEIFGNTHKELIYCTCKTISVDGCEYYMRINGNEGNYEVIRSR
jgi:hypothetical protein